MRKKSDEYAKLTIEETLKELETDKSRGLSEDEAQKRLSLYGYNEIPEKAESFFTEYSDDSGVLFPG